MTPLGRTPLRRPRCTGASWVGAAATAVPPLRRGSSRGVAVVRRASERRRAGRRDGGRESVRVAAAAGRVMVWRQRHRADVRTKVRQLEGTKDRRCKKMRGQNQNKRKRLAKFISLKELITFILIQHKSNTSSCRSSGGPATRGLGLMLY